VSGELATRRGVRRVAVKMMRPGDASVAESRAHAMAQRAAARGVCRLLGTCEKAGYTCIVMRRYERSLADALVDDGPMHQRRTRVVGHAICATLAALHGAGIVVCDLKPANVLLDAHDAPVLADFGVAEVPAEPAVRTLKGTLRYMAPETFEMRVGPESDVWAAACVLLEMHTGRAPWDGLGAHQIMAAVHVGGCTPVVPATMPARDVIRRCFAFAPSDRPTAAALARALLPRAPQKIKIKK
jgi:serine/threonine-protein kinase